MQKYYSKNTTFLNYIKALDIPTLFQETNFVTNFADKAELFNLFLPNRALK